MVDILHLRGCPLRACCSLNPPPPSALPYLPAVELQQLPGRFNPLAVTSSHGNRNMSFGNNILISCLRTWKQDICSNRKRPPSFTECICVWAWEPVIHNFYIYIYMLCCWWQGCGQVPVLVLVLVLNYNFISTWCTWVLDWRKCKVLVLDPKYLVKIKYFSSTAEPLICIYCWLFREFFAAVIM